MSPELVLVDPALARVERQRVVDDARIHVARRRPSPDVDRFAPASSRRREAAVRAVAILSLALNCAFGLVVLADHVDRGGRDTAAGTRGPSSRAAVRTEQRVPVPPAAATPVERRALRWLYRMPAAALPRAVAQATRTGRPTVRVACRRRGGPTSYGCSVWVGAKRLEQSLVVQYPAAAEGGALVRLGAGGGA